MEILIRKINKLKIPLNSEKKKLSINKYWLFAFNSWSEKKIKMHNNPTMKSKKNCLISGKKKKLVCNSNINSHIAKRLISSNKVPNFKKSLW